MATKSVISCCQSKF